MIADGARAASKENVRIQVRRTAIPIGNSSARWRISSQKDARLALLIRPEESTVGPTFASSIGVLQTERAAPIFRPPCSARQRRRVVDHFGRMTRGTIIVDRMRRFSRTCERIVKAQRRASAWRRRRRRTCSLSISRSRRRIWMRCLIGAMPLRATRESSKGPVRLRRSHGLNHQPAMKGWLPVPAPSTLQRSLAKGSTVNQFLVSSDACSQHWRDRPMASASQHRRPAAR
jgi:hypothetical protein